ncbi:MAG: GNAT family N-acetyltransferase [Saprospiraceae bacterium]
MISVKKTALGNILSYRAMYLEELKAQSRFHACHERGWTDSYIIQSDHQGIGYVSVKGNDTIEDRDTVFELFIIASFRKLLYLIYPEILQCTQARFIECQSNDISTSPILFECAHSISADTILFKEGVNNQLSLPGVEFREKKSDDKIFKHTSEPEGDYVLSDQGIIVATGGFLSHYNPPYTDLYMEVHPDQRRKGYGSYLIRELIRSCHLVGKTPSARCDIKNKASRACLLKGGMQVAGYILKGVIIST